MGERKVLRGRVVREKICESVPVSDLIEQRGWRAAVIHQRLIVKADDDGRFDAHPRVVRARCCPMDEVSLEDIDGDLKAMDALGLVVLYEVDGRSFGYFPHWEDNQQAPKQYAYRPSEFPTPPGFDPGSVWKQFRDDSTPTRRRLDADSTPTEPPLSALTEPNRTEPNLTQIPSPRKKKPAAKSKAEKPEVKPDGVCGWCENPTVDGNAPANLLQDMHDAYRYEFGKCPTILPRRDCSILKRLFAAGRTHEDILSAWGAYLSTEDQFVRGQGYSVPEFGRRFDRWRNEGDKNRDGPRPGEIWGTPGFEKTDQRIIELQEQAKAEAAKAQEAVA